MDWGTVELHPEVERWLFRLSDSEFGTVRFRVELLAERGVLLGEPHTRQLAGKVRELRFHLDDLDMRISYWIATDRRIILLTVFHKVRQHDQREIERAVRAYRNCVAEGHTAEEK
jgi:hypothetical protein